MLSRIFLSYLDHLIRHSDTPVEVIYTPGVPQTPRGDLISNSQALAHVTSVTSDAKPRSFNVCILTPNFYSRFASYTSLEDGLEAEMLSNDNAEENRTAQVCDPKAFCHLLLSSANKPAPDSSRSCTKGLLNHLKWLLVYSTRTRPPKGLYPELGNPHRRTQIVSIDAAVGVPLPPKTLPQRRHCGLSFLDKFVAESCSQRDQAAYRRALIRIFLSNRLAFGDERILEGYEFVIKLLVVAIIGRVLWARYLVWENWI